MKALPFEKLPEGDWLYEIKFDGYRALAIKNGKEVRLASRNQKALRKEPLSARRKLLAQVLKKPPEHVRLSGELRGTKDELLRVAHQLHRTRRQP